MKSVAAAASSSDRSSVASNRDTPTPPPMAAGDEDEEENGKSQRNRFRELSREFTQPLFFIMTHFRISPLRSGHRMILDRAIHHGCRLI